MCLYVFRRKCKEISDFVCLGLFSFFALVLKEVLFCFFTLMENKWLEKEKMAD